MIGASMAATSPMACRSWFSSMAGRQVRRKSWPRPWPIWGARVVVGSSTLGKGLVQVISRLPDGGELYVTWSRVLAPRGWPIQSLGVVPQVCTSAGPLDTGRVLADLAAGKQDMAGALSASRAARAPLPVERALKIRADCPAAEGGDWDLDAARFLATHPAAYRAALLPAPS